MVGRVTSRVAQCECQLPGPSANLCAPSVLGYVKIEHITLFFLLLVLLLLFYGYSFKICCPNS